MANNTQVVSGSGDFIRDIDRAGVKTQVVGIDIAIGTGTEVLLSAANPLPVDTVVKAASVDRGAIIGFSGAVITTTSGSNTITLTTAPTTGSLLLGQQIVATGIPAGSYIYALASGVQGAAGSTYTLSSLPGSLVAANAIASGTGVAVTSVGPQQIMAANASRRVVHYQVQSTTANVWINGVGAASADFHSLKIPSNTFYASDPQHVGTGAIAAIADTPATPLYAREG